MSAQFAGRTWIFGLQRRWAFRVGVCMAGYRVFWLGRVCFGYSVAQ